MTKKQFQSKFIWQLFFNDNNANKIQKNGHLIVEAQFLLTHIIYIKCIKHLQAHVFKTDV